MVLVRRRSLRCAPQAMASARTRSRHFGTTMSTFYCGARGRTRGLHDSTNRGRTRVLTNRVRVVGSPCLDNRVRGLVTSNRYTRSTLRRVYSVFVTVFSTTSSRLAGRHTTSIESVGDNILNVLLKMGRVGMDSTPGNAILITERLAPSIATNVMGRGVTNVVARANKAASRSTVLTETLRVPTMLDIRNITSDLGGNSAIMISNDRNTMVIGPSSGAITRCSGGHSTFLTRHGRLRGCEKQRAGSTDKRICRLFYGVKGPRSTIGTISTSNRNIKLFEARFLFVSEASVPARSRRFRTCGGTTLVLGNGSLVVEALSVNNSGSVPCLKLRGRRGPFVKFHTVECYLGGHRLFGSRVGTVLHTDTFNSVGVVFPLVAAVSRLHRNGGLITRYGTSLHGVNVGFGRGVRINIVIRATSTTIVTSVLTGRTSFFDVNAGSLANCAVTYSENGGSISCLCSPLRPDILEVVGHAVRYNIRGNVSIKVYNRTTTGGLVVPLLVSFKLARFDISTPSILGIEGVVSA